MATPIETLNEEMLLALSEKLKAWDANFRVMSELSAKLIELQDDMRSIKAKREIETPVAPSTFLNPQTSLPTEDTPQPIKLKDAIESVPIFDGHRPSVFRFLRACEHARNMVPRHQEPQLVKLLINKLRGHAFLAVEDTEVTSLNDFGNKLKDMFAPGKTVNAYKGELATIFQRPGEDILDYIDRVKDLRLAIMSGERCEYGTVFQERIDRDTREAFVKGLPNEVYIRVKIAGYQSLDDAYCQAVKATRELKEANDRIRYQHSIPPNNYNRNNRQDWRFIPPSRKHLNNPRIEEDVRKEARAIILEEKCINKYLDRNLNQKGDNVTLNNEAETRKLNNETIGNAYSLPNITEILDPLESANCLSTFDLTKIQKQDSTNFVNVSTTIGKKVANVSHSKISIKPSESNFIELKAKSLNCKKIQITQNENIAIPKSKLEFISKEVCNKNPKNNSKSTEDLPKRSIQINNNLIIMSTSSENIHTEKLEKNQHVANKVNKEGKRVIKEKDSKHFQAAETQVQQAQGNQTSKKGELPVENMCVYLNKYASHWIIIGLKILCCLLHLVFDVGNTSVDLMNPPGKHRWYHTILYLKYFWINIAIAFSKICILNAIGKQLDNWIGVSKPGFWRKIKTKIKKGKEIVIGYTLVLKPTLQSLNETIIEEDVKPTCADYLRGLFHKIYTLQQMARENLIKSKLGPKEYYDERINPQNFKIGELIYLLKGTQ